MLLGVDQVVVTMVVVMVMVVPDICQDVALAEAKICKIIKEKERGWGWVSCGQMVLRENYAYSGKMVRVITLVEEYQACGSDQPNCCNEEGCCDQRGRKLAVMVAVGVVTGGFFLIVFSTFTYTFVMYRREQQNSDAVITALPAAVEPRFNLHTYLTMAGVDRETLKAAAASRSAVRPLDVTLQSSEESSSSDEESDEEEE